MKQTLYLIIGFLFLACGHPKQLAIHPAPPVIPTPSIVGSWREAWIDYPSAKSLTYRWMSLNDSMCEGNLLYPHYYYLKHDTLFIKRDPRNDYGIDLQFPVLKLTADSLVLLSPYKDGYMGNKRMAMARITQQNTVTPKAIYFASGWNYGSAPRMYVEIDANRTFKFYGRLNIKPKGGFRGKLSETEYAAILTLINNLPLNELKEFYPGNADSQIRGMAIEWEGKLLKCSLRGTDRKVPPELALLCSKLIDVYKQVPLQPDSSVTESYFSQHPAAKPTTLLDDENEMRTFLQSLIKSM